ncbi:LOW QUALITY PROTEIN: DUF4378 domain-containing protein, partial [Cephalotus follicularis]
MGGLLHLFDFNQGGMARKILTQKTNVGGLEAPRNSLELQIDTSQSYCDVGDVPFSYPVEEDWFENNCYPVEVSMKKLMNEEISKQSNSRQNAPSIVARLMGIDVLPIDAKLVVHSNKKKKENTEVKCSTKERNGRGLVDHLSSNSNSFRRMEPDSDYHTKDRDADLWSTDQTYGKREHPQEEELQKFKKDFEAWQAARFSECSTVGGIDSFAQENPNKQKMAVLANSGVTVSEKPRKPNCHTLKALSHGGGSLPHHKHEMELSPPKRKELFLLRSRSRTLSEDFDLSSAMNYDRTLDNSSGPTRIVILKPGPDRIIDHEESLTSSSGTLEEKGCIEDFLEEVKERLKREMQGKTNKRGSAAIGSGIETHYSETPSGTKPSACRVAKQFRDSVSRDLDVNLSRSESMRSYRNEINFYEIGSPEFVNRDTRSFLAERQRNALRRDAHLDAPIAVYGRSRSSMLDNGRARLKLMDDAFEAGNERNYWEMVKGKQEMQTKSLRHGDDAGGVNTSFPKNLLRSLSAPVSGTSFGKLLLEDPHILTGTHIRRKHEAIESVSIEMRKRKKERFNFKKVSNFRYSFTLRGRLFGKKFQQLMESSSAYLYPVKDIMCGPTVVMNFGERRERHENSTEVPPSPASVCSSIQEEFWRPAEYLSPISTPDVSFGEDNAMPHVFKEISYNLLELRRQLNELESNSHGLLEKTINHEPIEPETNDLEDEAEAYIRDLLVASGLYDGSSGKTFSRWDPLAKPISSSIFEQVEELYTTLTKKNENSIEGHNEKKVDRKVILDLLNEALSTTVLGPPVTMSRFRRNMIGSSISRTLRGRKLLDYVWEIVRVYLHPPNDRSSYSLDSMVAQDLDTIPWSGLVDEETNALGKEVESFIIGDLIDGIAKDL